MRSRLAVLTASVVIISIAVITLAAYTSVSQILYMDVDRNLQAQAQRLKNFGGGQDPDNADVEEPYSPLSGAASMGSGALIIPRDQTGPSVEESAYTDVLYPAQLAVVRGEQSFSFKTEDNMRYYAVRASDGRVVVSQDIAFTLEALHSLRIVLILVGVTGALAAIIAGLAVGSAGVQPIDRLRRAVNRVALTGELRQIPVESNDELGSLTRSYNEMMRALRDSTEKQRDLVADAGHELKTPLTSLRTNIEFLMMASRSETASLSQKDREDVERDVVAQIDEMSNLIGDLVDLAREDAAPAKEEMVSLEAVFMDSLERISRRRPDVHFDMHLIPWTVVGEEFSLNRAIRNLLDNAAKWSPPGGTVRVWMEPIFDAERVDNPTAVEIRIADSGPGIPEEDRIKVFERFYRSIQSRSMPGSGLGLAIVKQVIVRHNGAIIADASDDGGHCSELCCRVNLAAGWVVAGWRSLRFLWFSQSLSSEHDRNPGVHREQWGSLKL